MCSWEALPFKGITGKVTLCSPFAPLGLLGHGISHLVWVTHLAAAAAAHLAWLAAAHSSSREGRAARLRAGGRGGWAVSTGALGTIVHRALGLRPSGGRAARLLLRAPVEPAQACRLQVSTEHEQALGAGGRQLRWPQPQASERQADSRLQSAGACQSVASGTELTCWVLTADWVLSHCPAWPWRFWSHASPVACCDWSTQHWQLLYCYTAPLEAIQEHDYWWA